jgi:hypothetical protein
MPNPVMIAESETTPDTAIQGIMRYLIMAQSAYGKCGGYIEAFKSRLDI